jgi:hypothetical protein
VRKLAKDFEATEVVLVGDRGMLEAQGRQLLSEQGFRYVTALTDPQVRKLLAQGTLQLELFGETAGRVHPAGQSQVLGKTWGPVGSPVHAEFSPAFRVL